MFLCFLSKRTQLDCHLARLTPDSLFPHLHPLTVCSEAGPNLASRSALPSAVASTGSQAPTLPSTTSGRTIPLTVRFRRTGRRTRDSGPQKTRSSSEKGSQLSGSCTVRSEDKMEREGAASDGCLTSLHDVRVRVGDFTGTDRSASIGSGWPVGLADEMIQTPFPRPLEEYANVSLAPFSLTLDAAQTDAPLHSRVALVARPLDPP